LERKQRSRRLSESGSRKWTVDVVGMRLDDVVKKIKGPKGEVRLTEKVDGTLKVISIIRDVVEIEETYAKSSGY
jgi:carboxyl-terminal processing protease